MWTQTYGGEKDDVPCSIVASSDGGYAVLGTTGSFGVNGLEFWLVKTDDHGNMEWNKTYGREGTAWQASTPSSIAATSDGGYAITGCFGIYDTAWLIKTDAQGNVQWNKTYPEKYKVTAVITTPDGGYALTGGTWLLKTDASGNVLWDRAYNFYEAGIGALMMTSDGGYALTAGYSFFKTDALGNMQWNLTYPRIETEVNDTYTQEFYLTYSVVASLDGGYAAAGYMVNASGTIIVLDERTSQTGYNGVNSLIEPYDEEPPFDGYYFEGFWLAKIDEFGKMQWNKTYSGAVIDCPCSLVATSDGGYALSGYTTAFDVQGDCLLVKTDADGNLMWNQTYGGPTRNKAYALIQVSDGGYVIAGIVTYPVVSWADFWLIKTDEFGVVPEHPSLLTLTLIIAATLPFLFLKKRLFSRRPASEPISGVT